MTSNNSNRILFLAPSPPPYMGPSIATEIILNSEFVKEFCVIHLDTCDRRTIGKLGDLDFINFYLAIKHYIQFLKHLLISSPEVVYVPISQTSIGYLRDLPFIFLAKLFRKKVILHLRGSYFRVFYSKSHFLTQFLIRKSLSNSDRLIVLGDSVKNDFFGLMPPKKISVIPNGLDLTLTKGEKKSKAFTVFYLSNFLKNKGYEEVIFSLNEVHKHTKNIEYLLAGWIDEQEKSKWESYFKELNLRDRVEFAGEINWEKKIELLKKSDVFVFPSYNEGLPWVIIEAMAAGLPIISTGVGCIPDAVKDGVNGFIIPIKDSASLVRKIKFLIDNPDRRYEMGRMSRLLYEKKFTKHHFVEGMIEAFKKTLNG